MSGGNYNLQACKSHDAEPVIAIRGSICGKKWIVDHLGLGSPRLAFSADIQRPCGLAQHLIRRIHTRACAFLALSGIVFA
jgi:hypothetical protein